MKIPYEHSTESLEDYYLHQAGHGLPYYSGTSIQRGYGLGNIFGRLFRTVLPFLKEGAKTVGKELIRTGVTIADDIAGGMDMKKAAKRRFQETGLALADKAVKKARTMVGGGYKRKLRRRKPIILAKATKPSASKDIFSS